MRSKYVFAAVNEVSNRFLLCRMASASARRLHQGSTQPSETINKSLKLIAAAEPEEHETALSCDDQPPGASAATAGNS
jgi:DNA-directed RNA polymerase subunit K/omega